MKPPWTVRRSINGEEGGGKDQDLREGGTNKIGAV